MRTSTLLSAFTIAAAPFYSNKEPVTGSCDGPEAPLLSTNPSPVVREEAALASFDMLKPEYSSDPQPSTAALIERRQPVLLRGTAVDGWPARRWTWDSLATLLDDEPLVDVAQIDGDLYMPVDEKAHLAPLLRYPSAYSTTNMSGRAFFHQVEAMRRQHQAEAAAAAAAAAHTGPTAAQSGAAQAAADHTGAGGESPSEHASSSASTAARNSSRAGTRGWRGTGRRLVHFGEVPPRLREALEPQAWLYPTAEDAQARLQSIWLSTPGVRTHTHFDSDPNLFVQILGHKRFVLWPPDQSEHLCPFPRLHPLWHKSRVDFEAPDTRAPCESYTASRAIVSDVTTRSLRKR